MIKAEVYKKIDLENSKQNHVSISGTRATHSLHHVDSIQGNSVKELLEVCEKLYGKEYDRTEDTIYLSIPESEWEEKECPENYEVFFEEYTFNRVSLD